MHPAPLRQPLWKFLKKNRRRKIKIYTGSGDRGITSLFSGERVKKSYNRVEAYGDVDELNSILGTLVAVFPEKGLELAEEVTQIQSELLHIGAWLATTPGSESLNLLKKISSENARFLETAIDRMEQQLPELGAFIVPGGHLSAGLAHMARTVCRRTERHVVRLRYEEKDTEDFSHLDGVIVFLNRLSDYLFVLARLCNKLDGKPDVLWMK